MHNTGVKSALSTSKTRLKSLSFDQAPSGVPLRILVSIFFLVSLLLGCPPCSTTRRLYNNVVAFTHHNCRLASNIDRPRFGLRGRIRMQVSIFLARLLDPDVSPSLTRTSAFEPIRLIRSPLQMIEIVAQPSSSFASVRLDPNILRTKWTPGLAIRTQCRGSHHIPPAIRLLLHYLREWRIRAEEQDTVALEFPRHQYAY